MLVPVSLLGFRWPLGAPDPARTTNEIVFERPDAHVRSARRLTVLLVLAPTAAMLADCFHAPRPSNAAWLVYFAVVAAIVFGSRAVVRSLQRRVVFGEAGVRVEEGETLLVTASWSEVVRIEGDAREPSLVLADGSRVGVHPYVDGCARFAGLAREALAEHARKRA